MKAARVGLALFACALGACASRSPLPPERVEGFLKETLAAADQQRMQGHAIEALELVDSVLKVDPLDPAALALRAQIGDAPEAEYLRESSALGSNLARRPRVQRSAAARAALFVPDRILDLLDVASLDVHLALGLYANAHVTRAGQLGAGARATAGAGLHDHRSIGALAQAESGVALPGAVSAAYAAAAVGTSGTSVAGDSRSGVARPADPLYQTFRDYWAVGFDFTYLILGLDFDVHPVQLGDWVAGFAGIDFLHDDFARTRGLALSNREESLIRRLYSVVRSQETLARYAEFRQQRAP